MHWLFFDSPCTLKRNLLSQQKENYNKTVLFSESEEDYLYKLNKLVKHGLNYNVKEDRLYEYKLPLFDIIYLKFPSYNIHKMYFTMLVYSNPNVRFFIETDEKFDDYKNLMVL